MEKVCQERPERHGLTWTAENSKADESSKIRWELVPYMRGRCIDIGAGKYKVFPHFISVDNGHHWGLRDIDEPVKDAKDLSIFASASIDLAYSSHLLEHFHHKDVPAVLREWMRVTKVGGHLALYVPDEDDYPKVGQPGANTDHKWNISFDKLMACMEQVECGWDLIDFQKRNEEDEYSLFFVFQKGGKGHRQSWKNPKPSKTCAIVRYGAIGDNVQASTILPWLKEQGYHVTFICQEGAGYEVIEHDPHIDRFIIQERNAIPNQFLGEFFQYTKKKYDKWIDLCEAIEYNLLAVPGSPPFWWPNAARKKHMDRNYLEWIHDVAEVPPPYRPKFYSTMEERAWAQKQKGNFGKRNILWSLAGSSGHKVWPHIDDILLRLLPSFPDVHVVLVGDETCKLLEQGWCRFDEGKDDFVETNPRVHLRSNKWTIRQSMAFAEVADLIIGTETGLLNAAGVMDTPKIINLSHSSEEMLTKYWKKVIPLKQPEGVGCSKQPCRQLHGGSGADPWMDCPQEKETGTSFCQFYIGPEMMWRAMQSVLGEAPALIRRAA